MQSYEVRWQNSAHLESLRPVLDAIFRRGTYFGPSDLSGLIVGLDGEHPALRNANFIKVILKDVRMVSSQVSCSFDQCNFTQVDFRDSLFDTCRMRKSAFFECQFPNTKFSAPSLDDAIFEKCSFEKAKLEGRGSKEYGGRRALFRQSDFRGASFKRLEFRASKFIGCRFEGAAFEKCDLRGVRIDGSQGMPAFTNCQISSTLINGVSVLE